MLKSAKIPNMRRSSLIHDKKLSNAIVLCTAPLNDELTLNREYEAFIDKNEAYLVLTNDKEATRSYSFENFTILKRITLLDKIIELIKYTNSMYDIC